MDPNGTPPANQPNSNAAPAKKKRFNANWNYRRRIAEPRQRPVAIEIPRTPYSSGGSTDDGENTSNFDLSFNVPAAAPYSIEIGADNGPYVGWKLYFPHKGALLHNLSF